jgi:UDP-N-acetylglucosamine--N-acetylmuramyl-(pentapeptide) pyrophosphoryl-undecaprenol N-acetylglucosamine transferase
MLRQRPVVVLGMGGFVTGPGGLMTWLLRKPLVIHEQNAIAGLTNRLLAPLAQRVLEAFPGTFHGKHITHTGNPVRRAIADLPIPEQRFAARSGVLRLLVLGGSLGARALNEVVPAALAQLSSRPEVWHQTGSRNLDETLEHYRAAAVTARVEPFIEDMAAAYGWADLVVCRAGALTVAELAAAGVGAVLVPYPYAVDDHQTRNAAYLSDAGAAVVIQQAEFTRERMCELWTSLADRARLLAMAQAARGLAQPQAAATVAALCWEAAHG